MLHAGLMNKEDIVELLDSETCRKSPAEPEFVCKEEPQMILVPQALSKQPAGLSHPRIEGFPDQIVPVSQKLDTGSDWLENRALTPTAAREPMEAVNSGLEAAAKPSIILE